jgi:hypothetical protein
MTTSLQQRRALGLLADAPHGRTVADMMAHGFTGRRRRFSDDDKARIIEERLDSIRS